MVGRVKKTVKRNSDQIDEIGLLCLAGNTSCDLWKKKIECSVPNAKHCSYKEEMKKKKKKTIPMAQTMGLTSFGPVSLALPN